MSSALQHHASGIQALKQWRWIRNTTRLGLERADCEYDTSCTVLLLHWQSRAEWQAGQRHRAVSITEEALAIEPSDQWTLEWLSYMQWQMGRIRDSWTTMRRVYQLPNYDPRNCKECMRRLRILGLAVGTIAAVSAATSLLVRKPYSRA